MKLKYIYFVKRFFYYFYGEKFFKRLNYDWNILPSRFEIIQKIIDYKKSQNYLEIGCDQDQNFSQIQIKNKIGIDPRSGGTHRMTSDMFFFKNNKKFDFIFIDGLHTYDQVSKDIKNSINALKENGIILVHDCLPKKIWNQIVPRLYGHWNGDVWKSIVEVRTMENLDTYTCVADHGLGVIIKRKNKNILQINNKNFKELKYRDYYNKHKEFMNPISFDELIKVI